MNLLTKYDIFLSLVSFNVELFMFWCLIVYSIYICFFYFNRIYIYTFPLVFLYMYSIMLVIFLSMNINSLVASVFGGNFYIHSIDIIIRNTIIIIGLPLIYMILVFFKNYYSIVNIVEYTLLMYVLIIALCLTLYCNDIISLFLSIELQSMIIYILICLRGNFSAINIGIRYFMLGTMVSLVFLFMFTILYYITGISSFIDFLYFSFFVRDNFIRYIIFVIYTLFLFKLYIYPFHFLGGDLYRHSPIYVLLVISSIIYYLYIYIFIKLVSYLYLDINIISILVCVTLVVGVTNILYQRDLRSFLGFGTTIHSTFLIYIIMMDVHFNLNACLFYALVYIISIVGLLICYNNFKKIDVRFSIRKNILSTINPNIIYLRNYSIRFSSLEYLTDWAGISKHYKIVSIVLSILFWSMSGLPPFSGFFSKFYVMTMCYVASSYSVLLIFILGSLISSLYYVKVIKEYFYLSKSFIYFDNLTDFNLLVLFSVFVLCCISVFLPELLFYIYY